MAGKKITQLNSGSVSNLPLSGVTAVVYSGTTFQHSLSGLRQILVDSGSHYFSGSQTINGNLTISGSITAQEYILSSSITNITTETISGSSNFGNSSDDNHNFTGSVKISGSLYLNNSEVSISGSGSHLAFYNGPKSLTWNDNFHIIENGNTLAVGLDITSVAGGDPEYRERLIVGGDTSHNIATFQESNGNHYAAINIINYNSGSNASADLVIGNDQNAESSSYVNLGINSSTHANLSCGYAGDAYLVNWGNDMYVGSMEIAGISGHGHTHLFSAGAWRNPGISMYNDTTIGFFTEKQNNQRFSIPSSSQGFRVEFSGSVKMDNNLKVDGWVSGSHFVGDGSQLTNLPTNLTNVSMFLSSSTFNSFTSSYNSVSASFDSRISAATNEQDLTYFATTGSNTFNGNQTISGSNYLAVGTIQNLSGSLNLITAGGNVEILASNLNVPNGGIITNYNVSASSLTGSLDYSNLTNVPIPTLISSGPTAPGSAVVANDTDVDINYSGYGTRWTFTVTGLTFPDSTIQTTAFTGIPSGTVSGSSQIQYSGLTGIPSGIISGSSQILHGSGIWSGSAQLPSGIISGSSQLPFGLVSGSSQISYTGITDVPNGLISGSSQISDLGYAITGSNTFIGDQIINGSLIIEGVSEVLTVDGGFNGNRTFDYTSGSIFYLTGVTGNGTWNVQNVPTTNNKAIALTYVIEQGVTPYSGSQYQINDSNVTVKWVDNTIPTGSANNTEIIGLTAFRVGSSWNVIGSLSTFGV